MMTTISVAIPDDRLSKLQDVAARFQVSSEELLRMTLDEILARPDEAFQRAASYVLKKNAELYERLS